MTVCPAFDAVEVDPDEMWLLALNGEFWAIEGDAEDPVTAEVPQEAAEAATEPGEDEFVDPEPEGDIDVLRGRYEAVTGKRADRRWGVERLQGELSGDD